MWTVSSVIGLYYLKKSCICTITYYLYRIVDQVPTSGDQWPPVTKLKHTVRGTWIFSTIGYDNMVTC